MKKINVEQISNWNIAKKTKNIKAKPLISIMVDRNVLNKFLVDTLEGREPLGDGSIIQSEDESFEKEYLDELLEEASNF